jgi:RNA polymerase sigma factor (sigma-70 family)
VSKTPDITELYEKHGGELLAYLARRCPAEAAHDLLQETFLQVIRHGRLGAVTMPRAWLFGIARKMLARHYRKESAGIQGINVCDQLTNNPDAIDPRLALMREAIGRLSPELRETLELRLEEELSYEEIAGVLDIPVGTVRSRLHNAVQRLRQALQSRE